MEYKGYVVKRNKAGETWPEHAANLRIVRKWIDLEALTNDDR